MDERSGAHEQSARAERASKINEIVEPHTHSLTHIYTHAHKRAAGINKIAEPDASVAVYLALLL